MANKDVQNQRFRDNYESPCRHLSVDNLKNLAKILDISSFPQDSAIILDKIIIDYFAEKDLYSRIPSLKKVKEALTKLSVHAKGELEAIKELLEAIKELDDFSFDRLSPVQYSDYSNLRDFLTGNPYLNDSNRTHAALTSFAVGADKVLNESGSGKGGRPKTQSALRGLIINLKAVYEDISNKKAGISYNAHVDHEQYQGPFFSFTYNILTIIHKEAIGSNNALGQQIKIALNIAKDLPKPDFERIPTIQNP